MTTASNKQKPAEEYINIKDFLHLCLSKWRWFVFALVLSLSIAFLYLQITPPSYKRTASVLIKEDTKGGALSSEVSGMADMGLFQTNTNVNNEIVSLRVPGLMLDVVKRKHLDVEYTIGGRFHDVVLYGTTLPINVNLIDLADSDECSFSIKLLNDNMVELSDFIVISAGKEHGSDNKVKGSLLDTLRTPLGEIIVNPTTYYGGKSDDHIEVTKKNMASTARQYSRNLHVGLNEDKTTIVDISFTDVSIQRADDVLNTLIAIYNENWVKDKNQIAISTSMFIDDRLRVIEHELGNVDDDISSYKSSNLVPDVATASAMYMSQSSEVATQLQELNNRLYMARYIRNHIASGGDNGQLLPANSGIESSGIEQQISEYNAMQLQRNNLVANSSEQNPLVVDMDQSLVALRQAITASVENYIVTLNEQVKSLQNVERQTTSRIAENPTQAKYLLTVERQQKVKESLYLFLLQKREENELSQAFTAYNTRIVQVPTGSLLPSTPVKRNVLMIAIVLGLLIPGIIILLYETLNTTVRGRKDLEGLSLPLIGEIPLFNQKKTGWRFWKKAPETEEIVVKHGSRDFINEAFRVLRTNLEFITGQDDHSNVIVVTSFNPGSGKSVLTMNIGVSLAIKGKKILIIDGDMRHASSSKFVDSPKTGLSNLLSNKADKPEDCIVSYKRYTNLDVLPVGTIPPNPTELLEGGRLGLIISRLREKYDYILIDCPPVDIVADTQIIEKYADRTIFVVRAGLLDRGMLPELESFYTEKRFKNMVAILNATSGNTGRYGYRYGYKYGYHYGYHNNSPKEKYVSKLRKWLKK